MLKRGFLHHNEWTKIYHTRIHSSKISPIAQIVVIHGWASSSNFIEIGLEFAKKGIITHIFDMRGFGYSGGARRNSKISDFIEDLHLVISQCFKDLPLFLYAHSLGGLIAMNYLILNPVKVSGIIFTSPYFSVPEVWKLNRTKEVLINLFGPVMDVSVSQLLENLLVSNIDRTW